MKKILVPCDFSQQAINAYRYALDIASKAKSRVELLNVIDVPVLHDTVLMPVLNFEAAMLEELEERTEKEFTKLKETYHSPGVKVSWSIEHGPTVRAILDFAEEGNFDLIVMGTNGATGLREVFVGSNAQKIIRRSRVPVLVTKEYSDSPVRDIVFPTNLGNDKQEELMTKVKQLQDFFEARLHIVYVNTPLNFVGDDVMYPRLQSFVDRNMLINYTVNIYNATDEEQGISQFARRVNAGLIAIGTHGRAGISHMVNGSLAEDVANHTDRLIWTYSLKNEPVYSIDKS